MKKIAIIAGMMLATAPAVLTAPAHADENSYSARVPEGLFGIGGSPRTGIRVGLLPPSWRDIALGAGYKVCADLYDGITPQQEAARWNELQPEDGQYVSSNVIPIAHAELCPDSPWSE